MIYSFTHFYKSNQMNLTANYIKLPISTRVYITSFPSFILIPAGHMQASRHPPHPHPRFPAMRHPVSLFHPMPHPSEINW